MVEIIALLLYLCMLTLSTHWDSCLSHRNSTTNIKTKTSQGSVLSPTSAFVCSSKLSKAIIKTLKEPLSVLSPTLYTIYTSDIVIKRNSGAIFYADNSAFVCSGKLSNAVVKRLKESLSCAEKYFLTWKIKTNQEKTQAINFPFNKSSKRIPSLSLTVNDTAIEVPNFNQINQILKSTFGQKVDF